MNFVTRLKTIEEAEKLNQLGIDVFCLDTEFTTKRIAIFSFEDIKKISYEYPERIYLLINKMIHESDLENLKNYLNLIKDLPIRGIVVNDISVYILAKEISLENKIIYQPGTMNTDTYSEEYFKKRNLLGITLSREITLEEIMKFDGKDIELSLIGHGYLDMFYSKRKLLTNYLVYKGIKGKIIKNKYNLRLNEEIREKEFYPIFEDEFGTHIFRSKKLISYQESKELKSVISDFFIERIFLDDEELYQTIKLYNNEITLEEFLNKYTDYDTGFYYRRTEKVKGEHDEKS